MQTDNHLQKKNSIKKAIVSALVSLTLFTVLYNIMIYQDMVMEKERYGYIAKN